MNSYKRLVENFWAPIMASYGVENRTAAIRIIAPPTCPASATRLEVRVCGADVNPYLAISAILASGYYGIVNKLELPFEALENGGCGDRLARNLAEATVRMKEPKSIARAVLGNDFVDHFVATREHEWRLWENSVTDWEVKRYMEPI